MPFGWDDALMMIPAGINLAQQIFGGDKGAGDQMQLAMQQLAEQREMARRQYELATAGRTDSRGTKTMYIPGEGWKTYLGPEAASQQTASDNLTREELIRQMVQGEPQRNREGRSRVEASSAAEPLLREFESGYSAPSKAGVRGKRIVSNVTAASEGADNIRNAATSTALRQGGSTTPLGSNLSSLDRNATAGIRTALARGEEEGDQMYDAMYKAWAGNKLDPYAALSGKASGTPGFRPVDPGGDAATSMNQAATVGAMRGSGSEAIARGYAGFPAAFAAGASHQQPSYDLFAAGIANVLKNSFGKGKSPTPWNEDSRNDAAYNSWRF